MTLRCLLAAALLALAPLAARAQRPALRTPTPPASPAAPADRVAAAVRGEAIAGALRFLADDLLEGRAPATRGGELAALYIGAEFQALGLEPAGADGYYHPVPIVALRPAPSLEVVGGAGAGGGGAGADTAARALTYRDEFVAWAERADTSVSASGEVVFVGYGISAPEWRWDDFKETDLRGKVLLMLVNDPGLRDPTVFHGRVLTYYGRWTYKLEEAARRGAAGVLLVHTDTSATYGWSTVVNSWTGEQVRLERPPTSLAWAGWLTEAAAARLLRDRGLELAQLMASAGRREFQPVATGLAVRGTVRSALRRISTHNVIGRLPGRDPALRDEAVLVTAHYDHKGIGQPVNGDSIMNGAQDNASGVAAMLAVARAFASSGVRPRRSILFVGVAAEESGLLGAVGFVERPTIPLAALAAVLNIDGANLYGATRDIAVLGADQSSLGEVFARAARAEGLRVTVSEDALLRGYFFRSDHFPFARSGVPALSWESGDDFVGKPAGWGRQEADRYTRERYHQVGDEILPWFTMDGAVQQARVLARVAYLVAEAPNQPTWKETSEFRAAGARRLEGAGRRDRQ